MAMMYCLKHQRGRDTQAVGSCVRGARGAGGKGHASVCLQRSADETGDVYLGHMAPSDQGGLYLCETEYRPLMIIRNGRRAESGRASWSIHMDRQWFGGDNGVVSCGGGQSNG
jgi:hypothetical protein